MKIFPPHFAAIVLAADRESFNPVAKAAGVQCKSLALVNGIPMVCRVIEALSSARNVKDRILCGPPKLILDQAVQLNDKVTLGEIQWIENKATPSASAYHAMQSISRDMPVLLTTSDHALLTAQVVDYFCMKARRSGCDVVAGFTPYKKVTEAYPETHRTAYRLKDGGYCTCNLFAFLTPRGRSATLFLQRIEQQRKRPLRVIGVFGWMSVIRYITRRLTLSQTLDRISKRLGFKVGAVILPFPEAAIDVDSVADWQMVQRIAT